MVATQRRRIVRTRFALLSTILAAAFFALVGEPARFALGYVGFGLFLVGVFSIAHLLVP